MKSKKHFRHVLALALSGSLLMMMVCVVALAQSGAAKSKVSTDMLGFGVIDFENDDYPKWYGEGYQRIDEAGHDGRNGYLEILQNKNYVSGDLSVPDMNGKAATVTVSFWAKTDDTEAADKPKLWLNGNTFVTSADWQQYTATAELPAGTNRKINISFESHGAKLYLDDVTATVTAEGKVVSAYGAESFEEDIPLLKDKAEQSTEEHHSGNQSVKLTGPGAYLVGFVSDETVLAEMAGKQVTFSVWPSAPVLLVHPRRSVFRTRQVQMCAPTSYLNSRPR